MPGLLSSPLTFGMQEGGTTADTCSGTLQYCPELVGHAEGAATGLAYVDKPTKPQHVAADCGFNVQYERVSVTPLSGFCILKLEPQVDLHGKNSGLPARLLAGQQRDGTASFLSSCKTDGTCVQR